MKRFGVCPSVCAGMNPQQQTRRCRFAAVGFIANDIDRLLQQRHVASECGQCQVVSVRR